MIYTVTFNPSLDYVVDVPEFGMGRVNRTSEERIIPGGKGVNVSIVLSNLGIDTRALCFVAGFTGKAFKTLLDNKKINADYINVEEGTTRINVKLRTGEETEINGKGPVVNNEHLLTLQQKLDYLDEEDFLVLAGSIPDSMPKSTYMDIMQRLQYNNIKIIVDAGGELLLNVLPYKPFLIKPNVAELSEIFGVEVKTKDDAITYGKKLMEKGARNVLISMAADGAVLLAEDGNVYQAVAPKGVVKNSVGAGDSMLAGFLAGYIQEGDYKQAFNMGICAGSASAFSEELATKSEIEELMKQF